MNLAAQPKQQIALRIVGEVLTDHTGHFYELRGDDLRELGKLVTDGRGRIFEIADAKTSPPEPETSVVNGRSIFSRLMNWFSRNFAGDACT